MQEFGRQQPLVSIVIPAKDSEATIERCMRSISEQTYRNREVIVVDNYSKDRTRQISKKYGAKVYLRGPERGAQVNLGVKEAAGKYVYRVDSDFVLQPDVVREAVEACETRGCDAIIIHNTSDPTVSLWAKVRKAERDCYRGGQLNVAARFCKKKVFERIGGFDERLVAADDYDFHNRLVSGGYRIGRVNSEEVHIGEPKTLLEVVRTHYRYGKSIRGFIRKNPEKALRQLSPLRESYAKGISSLLRDPVLAMGFAVYQFSRYAATAIGIISKSNELIPRVSAERRCGKTKGTTADYREGTERTNTSWSPLLLSGMTSSDEYER